MAISYEHTARRILTIHGKPYKPGMVIVDDVLSKIHPTNLKCMVARGDIVVTPISTPDPVAPPVAEAPTFRRGKKPKAEAATEE